MSDDEYSESNYRAHVKLLADQVHEECDEACESYEERLSEAVDGSRFHFNYAGALAVLRYSRNDDAIFGEAGDNPFEGCSHMGAVYCRAAYFALKQDVMDYLDGYPDPELEYTVTIRWKTVDDDHPDDEDLWEDDDDEVEEFPTLSKAREWAKKRVPEIEARPEVAEGSVEAQIEDSEGDDYELEDDDESAE